MMIASINEFFIARSSGRRVLIWFGLVLLWVTLFGTVLIPNFEGVTSGHSPVDIAFPTTPELIFSQLPAYTPASYRAYLWFAIVDYLYPPTLAFFIATLWAWLFHRGPNRFFAALQRGGILILPFVAALLDWLENAGFLIVIYNYPPELWNVARAACALKQAKLMIHGTNLALTAVFAVTAVLNWRRASI